MASQSDCPVDLPEVSLSGADESRGQAAYDNLLMSFPAAAQTICDAFYMARSQKALPKAGH